METYKAESLPQESRVFSENILETSSMLQQTLPPKVGVEETKAGHSGRQMG